MAGVLVWVVVSFAVIVGIFLFYSFAPFGKAKKTPIISIGRSHFFCEGLGDQIIERVDDIGNGEVAFSLSPSDFRIPRKLSELRIKNWVSFLKGNPPIITTDSDRKSNNLLLEYGDRSEERVSRLLLNQDEESKRVIDTVGRLSRSGERTERDSPRE